jgi:hypothetical protein
MFNRLAGECYVEPFDGPPAAIACISSRDNDAKLVCDDAAIAAAAARDDDEVFVDVIFAVVAVRAASTRQLAASTAALLAGVFHNRLAAGLTLHS